LGAVVLILAASFGGVIVSLIGTVRPSMRLQPFWLALLKTFGTGIVLACSLVHMLQPADESLTSDCVPEGLREGYPAMAYAVAMAAAMGMQQIEMVIAGCVGARGCGMKAASGVDEEQALTLPFVHPNEPLGKDVGQGKGAGVQLPQSLTGARSGADKLAMHSEHSLVSAISAEFGFTVHSVFIGLAVGVVSDEALPVLMVALSFHQLFEGVALGARLAGSNLSVHLQWLLASVFAVSAPLGIAAGVGAMTGGTLDPAGGTFLLVQGMFDAVCAGILLHVGFSLLQKDLPADVAAACPPGSKHRVWKGAAIHTALWMGGGLMAFIGLYL
jgi:zinc transporter 1/2/3